MSMNTPADSSPIPEPTTTPAGSTEGPATRLPHVVVLLGRSVTVRPTVITGMVGRKIGGGAVNDEQVDFEGWIAEYEGRTARSMDSYDAARTVLALFDVGGRVKAHRIHSVEHEGGVGYDVDVEADGRRDRREAVATTEGEAL